MKNRLKVVLDTNILLVSVSSHSKYHKIFKYLIDGKYEMAISNEIIEEYKEIISKKFNHNVALNTIRTLLLLPNVKKVESYFKWNLIQDPDDNKFVDCALMYGADYLVTNDKDFNILKDIEFPRLATVNIENFINTL